MKLGHVSLVVQAINLCLSTAGAYCKAPVWSQITFVYFVLYFLCFHLPLFSRSGVVVVLVSTVELSMKNDCYSQGCSREVVVELNKSKFRIPRMTRNSPHLSTFSSMMGKHGIGRIDISENRFVGIKSRDAAAGGPYGSGGYHHGPGSQADH